MARTKKQKKPSQLEPRIEKTVVASPSLDPIHLHAEHSEVTDALSFVGPFLESLNDVFQPIENIDLSTQESALREVEMAQTRLDAIQEKKQKLALLQKALRS